MLQYVLIVKIFRQTLKLKHNVRKINVRGLFFYREKLESETEE